MIPFLNVNFIQPYILNEKDALTNKKVKHVFNASGHKFPTLKWSIES